MILVFLPLYKAKRRHHYFDSFKVDSRNVTNSMTFATKSSNQNFIISSIKSKQPSLGTKGCDFLPFLVS